MTQIKVYTTTGSTTSTLPKELNFKPNMGLLAQARHILNDSVHPRLARAKTRSEVALSHKKIYKQKGTGGARHGARSAPIFVGGGAAHGPKGDKRKLRLNGKMRALAVTTAISLLATGNKLAFAGGLTKITKTKDAQKLVDNLRKDYTQVTKVTFALTTATATRFFKNIKNVKVMQRNKLSALAVLTSGVLVLEQATKISTAQGVSTKKRKTKSKVKSTKK